MHNPGQPYHSADTQPIAPQMAERQMPERVRYSVEEREYRQRQNMHQLLNRQPH